MFIIKLYINLIFKENLVGRDFLPRGSGLVTRRPLVIQLNRVENSTEGKLL